MAFKLTTTKEAAVLNGLKVLVYGGAGVGKTRLCSTASDALIISAESGLLSLAEFDIPVVEIYSIEDLEVAYQYVTESEEGKAFSWICLDSITEIAEQCLANEKEKSKDPRKAYGELSDRMTEILKAFRDLPGRNVYMSCKALTVKDEDLKMMVHSPMMPGQKLGQALPYLFDEVFALRAEKNLESGDLERMLQTAACQNWQAKDRSGRLDEFEEPNLDAILAKITGKKTKTKTKTEDKK